MWVLRAYNPADDELVFEQPLSHATASDLEGVLGFAPSPFGSTPLDAAQVDRIAAAFGFSVPDGVESFVDFDLARDELTFA